jgi:hypothetical protein
MRKIRQVSSHTKVLLHSAFDFVNCNNAGLQNSQEGNVVGEDAESAAE